MCLATCNNLFVDSHSLVGDGVFLDLTTLWRLGVSSGMRLGGAGVGRRPLASVVAENPRDLVVFFNLLQFYLQALVENRALVLNRSEL
jgi:hypothetical protein